MVIRIVLGVAIAASAACSYGGSFVDCEVACTPSTGCPPSFTCGPEGRCRPLEAVATCAAILDGGSSHDGSSDGGSSDGGSSCNGVSQPAGCTLFECAGTCHLYCTSPMAWNDAKVFCETSWVGWLAEVESAAEDACIDPRLMGDAWIGLLQMPPTQASPGAGWQWQHSGALLGYSDWKSGQPDDSVPPEDNEQNCARIDGPPELQWNDKECTSTYGFVCELF